MYPELDPRRGRPALVARMSRTWASRGMAMNSARARIRVAIAASLAVLLVVGLIALSAPAQQSVPALRVATRVLPPMVVDQGGKLSGFSIELWDRIAERLQLRFSYQVMPDVRALLEAVRSGDVDLGVAAVSITAERERVFEFSQPIMNAGMQILVRSSGEAADNNPLDDLLGLMLSRTFLIWLGVAIMLSLVPAHLIWFFERRQAGGMLPDRRYFPGIFHALYWATSTLTAQGDHSPLQWLARAIAVLWKFAAVVFIAFYTAQLTAALTVQQIQGSISGPDDLAGKRVGTTRGSTSAALLRRYKAQVQEFAMITDAYKALIDKQLDAVVFDAPVVLYYAATEGKGRVQTIGGAFHKEDYGIVFPSDTPLRKQVNAALLALREDGTYDRIYDKWFGRK
jgi:polar amino acid transport system substrate-binding protein